MNNELTNLDTDQIIKRQYDVQHDANRVYLVGGSTLELSIDSNKIVDAVKDGLNNLKIEIPQQEQQITTDRIIEKNVFIPQVEIKTIEVPVIIKEIEYKTIEIPVITEKIVTIEKPIVIKEIEFKEIYREKEFPMWHKVCTIIQTIVVIGLLLSHFIK